MANESGKAYGLTVLSPLRSDKHEKESFTAKLRQRFIEFAVDEESPMARVPNTYLCRFFVLDDVPYQGKPAISEHLQSRYLVFVCELHGELVPYLRGMWENAHEMISEVWQYCIGFEGVKSADDFVHYIKRCQVETTFYFNGSNDEPLAEQLKALYLKQEFARFARENQGKNAMEMQKAFAAFVERTQPSNIVYPTWKAGASSLGVL